MKIKSFFLLSIFLFSLNSNGQEPDQKKFNPNRLIVKIKEDKASFSQELFNHSLITSVKNLYSSVYIVETSNAVILQKNLNATGSFDYVEKDYRRSKRSLGTPKETSINHKNLNSRFTTWQSQFNDPYILIQWSFLDENQNGVSVFKAYEQRKIFPAKDVIVAVIDTGVDTEHEDLKDVMWTNTQEIADNGIDDDLNGYIDDVHGISTLERDSEGRATGNVTDQNSHGTHVSGIIAATQNNKKGIAGIASRAKIMAIRSIPSDGDELDIDVIESLIYAAKNGAKIINCSFGKSENEGGLAVRDALNFIHKNYDVLVIAAAGNDSKNIDHKYIYPASYDSENLLVVASTTAGGSKSYFSNHGKVSVDIAAPGSEIHSTIPQNKYKSYSGTSMASPTTAGVAAEVLSTYPQLSAVQLKKILLDSSTPVTRFEQFVLSGGRVNLYNALEEAAKNQ